MTARHLVAERRPRIRAALLAAGTGLGLLTAGCTSSAPTSALPTMKDVASLLARHGTAALDHNRSAFLADISTATKSTTFRQDQEGVYDNVVTLPLTHWSYTASVRTDDRSAERAAAKRYGLPALIVRVTLRYALRAVDAKPTNHDLFWTFVRRDGRVVIAGDGDLAENGGSSWRGPWDFGPLTVVRGTHSLVLGHEPFGPTLKTIAATVDAAVPVVTSVWGSRWSQQVAVVVPSTADELAADAGPTSTVTTSVAAVATADGKDPLTGTAYGQRLIVNPGALARLSDVGRRITVEHEITHIASASDTSDATPRWLVEGFADYVGNLRNGQPVHVIATELRADVRHGKLPKALPSEQAFDTEATAAQAYEGGWLACRLVAQHAGQAGLVHFYLMVGRSNDAERALPDAVRTVMHETVARFTAQWRAYVEAELR